MTHSATESLRTQIAQIEARISEAEALAISDPSLADLVKEEITDLSIQKSALADSFSLLSGTFEKIEASTDPDAVYDNSAAIIEVRGGAGGEEAKIFADNLIRMYVKFCETHKYKIEWLDDSVIKIRGKQAYGTFKYEAGVHRVQRVPETESSGRIHTSTASVAVLPEVPDSRIEVREEDLDWKFTTGGGHGGQNVNKVATAVLLTHRPSGIVISCRQERYQQQNRDIALELLRSRLWEKEEEKRLATLTEKRRNAVGTAARSEKIRTYNFPQSRVTDHRIKKSWHNLNEILSGYLDDIIEALKNPTTTCPEEGGVADADEVND